MASANVTASDHYLAVAMQPLLLAAVADGFGDGQETVLFVTGLTRNSHAAAFIREYGCDPYFACSEKLLYRKQEKKLQEECASLLEI